MVKLTVYRPGESALEAKLDTGAYVIGASKDCHREKQAEERPVQFK